MIVGFHSVGEWNETPHSAIEAGAAKGGSRK
jgi:hypothetical protein